MGYSPNLFETRFLESMSYSFSPFYNEFLLSNTIQNSGNKGLLRNTVCALYVKPCLQPLMVLELRDQTNRSTLVIFKLWSSYPLSAP